MSNKSKGELLTELINEVAEKVAEKIIIPSIPNPMPAPNSNKEKSPVYITITEAAKRLGVSRPKFNSLVSNGIIPFYQIKL